MTEQRNSLWVLLALGAMTLLVLAFATSAWRGGETTGDVVRSVSQAAPDLRPKLPEVPRLPDAPIPIPK